VKIKISTATVVLIVAEVELGLGTRVARLWLPFLNCVAVQKHGSHVVREAQIERVEAGGVVLQIGNLVSAHLFPRRDVVHQQVGVVEKKENFYAK